MRKFNFETPEQFEKVFSAGSLEVTDAIVEAIEEALIKNKKTAYLFEISFVPVDLVYEINLPQSQWVEGLQKCLDYYHKADKVDAQIDTWKLLEAVKVCV